jgi:hypothetical protein
MVIYSHNMFIVQAKVINYKFTQPDSKDYSYSTNKKLFYKAKSFMAAVAGIKPLKFSLLNGVYESAGKVLIMKTMSYRKFIGQ